MSHDIKSEHDEMSEELRAAIVAMKPDTFEIIVKAFSAYRRAEAVIERHRAKTGKILLIKEVRDRACVGWRIARAAVQMARNRQPCNE